MSGAPEEMLQEEAVVDALNTLRGGYENMKIGIDIVHIPRIKSSIKERGARFLSKIFTPEGDRCCTSGRVPIHPLC